MPLTVCVFCSASDDIDPRYISLAEHVGREVGRRGWTLVSGGGSVSMMGAVARGARAKGGLTIGVIPRLLRDVEIGDHEVAELVVTDDMRQRKGIMDERSDGFLALPGGLGTLEELLEVWVSRTLGMHDKPVVALDPDGVFTGLRQQVADLVASGFVRPSARDALSWFTQVEPALDAIAAGVGAARMRPTSAEVIEADP
jgi:uncharacterized protein (TIGR00730 family)